MQYEVSRWVTCRYDEFGRLKKQFRGGDADRKAREEAALARLHGSSGSGVLLSPPAPMHVTPCRPLDVRYCPAFRDIPVFSVGFALLLDAIDGIWDHLPACSAVQHQPWWCTILKT